MKNEKTNGISDKRLHFLGHEYVFGLFLPLKVWTDGIVMVKLASLLYIFVNYTRSGVNRHEAIPE